MALIECPSCGAKISDRAETCPKCGKVLNSNDSTFMEEETRGSRLSKSFLISTACIMSISIIALCIWLFMYNKPKCEYEDLLNSVKVDNRMLKEELNNQLEESEHNSLLAEDSVESVGEEYNDSVDVQSSSTYEVRWSRFFEGKVDKYPIVMYLKCDNNKIIGTYYYKRMGADNKLNLSGTYYDGDVDLIETAADGNSSGQFQGRIEGDSFYGTFTTQNGKIMQFEVYVK